MVSVCFCWFRRFRFDLSLHTESTFIFQYKSEKDGVVETRIERKITVEGDADDDDDIDHDFVSALLRLCGPMNHRRNLSTTQ